MLYEENLNLVASSIIEKSISISNTSTIHIINIKGDKYLFFITSHQVPDVYIENNKIIFSEKSIKKYELMYCPNCYKLSSVLIEKFPCEDNTKESQYVIRCTECYSYSNALTLEVAIKNYFIGKLNLGMWKNIK